MTAPETIPTPACVADAPTPLPAPRGPVERLTVPWDQLRAGDVIVCCGGVPWQHPRTVISAIADEHNTDHFWLRTVEAGEEVPAGGALYNMAFNWLIERRTEVSRLEEHAERELRAAGMFDADGDYNGSLGRDVMDLMRAFCGRGHSGGSAHAVLGAFDRVARWQNLTPITNNPDEWMDVAEIVADQNPARLWQSRRNPALFSVDGGRHYYNVDETARERGADAKFAIVDGVPRVLYTAQDPNQPAPPTVSPWVGVVAMCERWHSDHPIDQAVLEDMRARRDNARIVIGLSDPLVASYEHLLDAIGDLATVIIAKGLELDTMNTALGEMLWRTISSAANVREMMMREEGSKPFNVTPDPELTAIADGRPKA